MRSGLIRWCSKDLGLSIHDIQKVIWKEGGHEKGGLVVLSVNAMYLAHHRDVIFHAKYTISQQYLSSFNFTWRFHSFTLSFTIVALFWVVHLLGLKTCTYLNKMQLQMQMQLQHGWRFQICSIFI